MVEEQAHEMGGKSVEGFYEVVKGRRSIRKFLDKPVPMEDIKEIIEVATRAPSAGNEQMWRFIVITRRETIENMRQAVLDAASKLLAEVKAKVPSENLPELHTLTRFSTLFAGAPVVIAVTAKPYRSQTDRLLRLSGLSEREIDYLRCRPELQSVGAAIQTLLLAAHAKGYGTCWMTGPNLARPALEEILGIKSPEFLATIIPMGYPAETPPPRPRKSVDEVILIWT